MGIEARKSAWGRSWSWAPPITLVPGKHGYHTGEKCILLQGDDGKTITVDPCHKVALRPNTKYVLTGAVRATKGAALKLQLSGIATGEPITGDHKWPKFRRELTTKDGQWWMPRLVLSLKGKGTVWLRDLSLRETPAGPELLWEADVNRPPRGWYNQPDCLMLDRLVESAEKHGIILELCLLTRDHYMHALKEPGSPAYEAAVADAKKLLRYAVARWGYSTHVAVWEYFNEMNPGLPLERFYAECSAFLRRHDPYRHLIAVSHWHPSPKWWRHPAFDMADEHFYCRPATGPLFKDAAAAAISRAKLLRDAAPGRPALISEFGVLEDNWQPTPHLKKDTRFVHHHNALWASALSGLSGTVMHWSWDDIHKRDLYGNYRGVARFVADIPWTTAKLRKVDASASDKKLRVVGLQGDDRAYLWLQDRDATWWNLGVKGKKLEEVRDTKLTIRGLRPGGYGVRWWDTRTGRMLNAWVIRAPRGVLKFPIFPFTHDTACSVVLEKPN